MKVEFRNATQNDLPALVDILNNIILEGGFNADLSTYSIEEKQAWFNKVTTLPYALLCLENEQEIIGYCYLSPWRNGREALAKVTEVSYYLKKEFRKQGFGKLMVQTITKTAKQNGFEKLLAILLDTNLRSVQLLEKEGFTIAGHLKDVAKLANSTAGQFIYIKSLAFK